MALRQSGHSLATWPTYRLKQQVGKLLLILLVTAGGVVLLVPLVWMLSTSLKPLGQIWTFPPQWIPETPLWENYGTVFTTRPYFTYLLNTVIIIVVAEIGTLFSCSLIAFGFARTRFPGRDLLFYVVLGTMMIPGYATLIPMFVL